MKLGRFLLICLLAEMVMSQLVLDTAARAALLPDLLLGILFLVLNSAKLKEVSAYILLASVLRELLSVSGFGFKFMAIIIGGYLFYFLSARLGQDGNASRLGLSAFLAALAANLISQFSIADLTGIILSAAATAAVYLLMLTTTDFIRRFRLRRLKLGMS